MSKIMLIDGNSLINRAFYALPPLTNQDGFITNAVYGFLNMFFKFYDEEKPHKVVVAFDLPGPTFRHEMFLEYKGTRKKMPDELRPQIPLLKEVLHTMNIEVCELPGYEADDILGTLAKTAEVEGYEIVLISGDRDLLQIASDKITIKIPKTKSGRTEVESYSKQVFIDIYGIMPSEYIDVKALMGDSSDNIPGVPGIGEKTAFKIISEYGSIENAILNVDKIKPKKASENLKEFEAEAKLSKALATINTNSPIGLTETQTDNIFNEKAFEMVKQLGFKTHYTRFSTTKEEERKISNVDFDMIKTNDTVALSLIDFDGEFCGISFFCEGMSYFYEGLDFSQDMIDFLLGSTKKVLFDYKRDKLFLKKMGIELNNVIFDVSLAGYVLNCSKSSYNYNDIAEEFLGKSYKSVEELTGKGRAKRKFSDLSTEEKLNYAILQSEVAFLSHPIILEKIKENEQHTLYFEIELPLVDVLCDMEFHGVKIDKDALLEYNNKLEVAINILTDNIYKLAGEEFNINSPKQLGVILFERLMLKGAKKTKTGYSTAADVLDILKESHPIINEILSYRTLSKLKSTYCEGLLDVMDSTTNKIHTTFQQKITNTGRLSSIDPNLQNIPIRAELGRALRKVFIPTDETYVFADADYSQIELRVLAHMSADSTMIEGFKNNADIHRITAAQILGISEEDVTNEQRSSAKAINFGIVYGISAFSLSDDINVTVREAEEYIHAYLTKYQKVKEYMDNSIKFAKEHGYAKTIFNRRRSIDELKASNFMTRAFGERAAMNMPIQGTAADIIKIAMIKVYKKLKEMGLASRLILQVHDELLIEAKRNEIDIVKELLKEEMENAVNLLVPITADVHIGETWYDAK